MAAKPEQAPASIGSLRRPMRSESQPQAGAPAVNPNRIGAITEAVSALVNLGIDTSSATRAVASAAKQFDADAPAPELIRAALKEVSR